MTFLHDEAEVRDTILHEIAHALVGPEHQHDEVWRRTAVRIGSTGTRCVSDDAPRVAGNWRGTCSAGHAVERHKRPERLLSCPQCNPKFDVNHLFEWTFRGRPAAMHPNYLAELEAKIAGRRIERVPVGDVVRVVVPGEFHGRVGTVIKHGRTSYHVRLDDAVLRVVFAGALPLRS